MKIILSNTRKCPNCRGRLLQREIKKNLIIEDIIQTQNKLELQSNKSEDETHKCRIHNEKLIMFCLKCEEYVCAECISLDIHIGHELRSLKHIYNEIKEVTAEETK